MLEQPTGKILFEMLNRDNRRTGLDSFSVVLTLG